MSDFEDVINLSSDEDSHRPIEVIDLSDEESKYDSSDEMESIGVINEMHREEMESLGTVNLVQQLQDICLSTIVDNFPRYHNAFTSSPAKFQMSSKFLQKRHSAFLIEEVLVDGQLDEKYWSFLINEHLGELDMSILIEGNWDQIALRMNEIGHSFVKIKLDKLFIWTSDKVIEFVNRIVCKFPKVEILYLGSNCNDRTLQNISSSCPELKELYIEKCDITSDGLRSLCQNDRTGENYLQLKILSVHYEPNESLTSPEPPVQELDDGIIFLLQNMPSLEKIFYAPLPNLLLSLYEKDLNNTSIKYNLTSINLLEKVVLSMGSCYAENILTALTIICPHLKEIFLSLRTAKQLNSLFKFTELETIIVKEVASPNGLNVDELLQRNGKALRRLRLQSVIVSTRTIIQNCPHLEFLCLDHLYFTQPAYPENRSLRLNKLNELSILTQLFSDEDGGIIMQSLKAVLNSCPNLEKLSFENCSFSLSPNMLAELTKFCEDCQLQFVKFKNCDIVETLLQSILLSCSSLEILIIESCPNIRGAQIDHLYDITCSLKNRIEIIWDDDRSEFDSLDDPDIDIFDEYSEYESDDMYFGYDGSDFDTYSDHS